MNFNQFFRFKFNKSIVMLLMTLMITFTGNVYAFDLFHPMAQNSDLLIKFIIDPLSESNVSENSIAAVSSVFLMGLLVVGAILFIYNVIVSTTSTALQGELMGKKASTTFTVARNVVGVSMIIPFSGGLATIQHIVIWLAIQGVLLGDTAWEKFLDEQPLNSQILLNKAVELKIIDNIKPIALAHLCYANLEDIQKASKSGNDKGLNKNYNIEEVGIYGGQNVKKSTGNNAFTNRGNVGANGSYLDKVASANDVSRLDNANNRMDIYNRKKSSLISIGYKNKKGTGDTESFCGQFELMTQRSAGNSSFIQVTQNSNVNRRKDAKFYNDELSMQNINTLKGLSAILDLDEMRNEVQDFHEKEFRKLIGVNKPGYGYAVAEKLRKNESEDAIVGEIIKTAKTYMTDLHTFAKQKATALNNTVNGTNIITAMKKDGIASAGAWFWSIVSQGANYSDLINTTPNLITLRMVGYGTNGEKFSGNNNNFASTMDVLEAALPNENGADASGNNYSEGRRFKDVMNKGESALNKALAAISDNNIYSNSDLTIANANFNFDEKSTKFLQLFVGEKSSPLGLGDFVYKADENPVITVHNLGKKMLWWIQSVLNGALAGDFKDSVSIVLPFFLGMLIPAVTMVWYIPLLPFILWMGSLIGWVVMLLQSMFGAPLWMLAHLTPDKEGFVGRQGQGYMLILSLFIRPILMVIGYVIALTLLNPIGKLINAFFGFAAMSVLGGTNFIWLLGVIAVSVIYAMVLQNTVKKVFSLMHVIPDSLLQWFGGNSAPILGEYANGIEQGSMQGVSQMGSSISGVGSSLAYKTNMGSGAGASAGSKHGIAGMSSASAGSANNGLEGLFNNMASGLSKAKENVDALSSGEQTHGPLDQILEKSGFGGMPDHVDNGHNTMSQRAENEAQYRAFNRDMNSWQQLSSDQQRNILNSGATSYADTKGNLHMIPVNASVDGASRTAMDNYQSIGVPQDALNTSADSIGKSIKTAGNDNVAITANVRDAALRNGSTYDLKNGRVVMPDQKGINTKYNY